MYVQTFGWQYFSENLNVANYIAQVVGIFAANLIHFE